MDYIQQTRTALELLLAGASYLKELDVEDSRVEADILLSYACGTSRDRLYLQLDAVVDECRKNRYIQFLQRRGLREPLAYILNRRDFMASDFYVDERVLIPRPETELLVVKALDGLKTKIKSQIRVLDLCTGSGVLAVTLARRWPEASVVATDISEEALAVARINADKFRAKVDFRQGDLFEPVKGDRFDLIISNPPYVSADEYEKCSPEVKKEPHLALLGGTDGLDFYRRISEEIWRYLRPGGRVLLEIGSGQALAVIELFEKKGYKCTLDFDLSGLDRIVLIEEE